MKKIKKIIVILTCLYSCIPQQALCLNLNDTELGDIATTIIKSTATIGGITCVSTFAHESGHALTAKLFGCYKSMHLGGDPKKNKKPLLTLKPLNIHIEGADPFCGSVKLKDNDWTPWKGSLISSAGPLAGAATCAIIAYYTKNQLSLPDALGFNLSLFFTSVNLLNFIPRKFTCNQSDKVYISDGGHIIINHCDEKTAKKVLAYGKLTRSTLDYVVPLLLTLSPVYRISIDNTQTKLY